jgi:thioredoxin-related protein
MRLSRFSFISILALVFYSQIAVSSVGRDPAVYFFNETWGNFQEELVKAREEGKKGILLFFEIDICPFCHRMKRTVLNQPEVQEYFRENFLIFSVDVEGDVEMVDFDGKTINQNVFSEKVNRVRATPVFMFYDHLCGLVNILLADIIKNYVLQNLNAKRKKPPGKLNEFVT